MKTVIKTFMLLFAINLMVCIVPQKAAAQVSVSFQVFYDDLSPYGNWIDNADYGYVWVPNVSSGFTPYATNGYWVFTDEGWTWVSNYSWGWAPFHYGRWFYEPYYGWLWVPDNEWGPGWVTWRRSESYYGWAPIGPGISIDFAYGSGYNVPYNQWTFVRDRDFGRTNINNYYINHSRNVTIINNTTVINNIRTDRPRNVRYNAGPERSEVEKRAGKKFTPVTVRESNNPGQRLNKTELQIYRPRVERNNADGRRPAPSKVSTIKDVKPITNRNGGNQSQKNNQPTRQETQQQPNKQPERQQPQQQQPQQQQQPKRQEQQPNKQPERQQPQQQQPRQQPQQQQQPKRQEQQPNKQQQQQPKEKGRGGKDQTN